MQTRQLVIRTGRGLRRLWPQVPLGLFLILAGALNILAGLHTDILGHLVGAGTAAGMAALSHQTSLAALGSGAQIILGAGLLLSGVALFWKLRIAWIYALLLLAIAVAINVVKAHFGGSMIIPSIAFVLLALARHSFQRQTLLGGSIMSFTGIIAVLAYGTFGIYLLGDQFAPHIKSPLTALYYTIETLSTIGYGDYHANTLFAQGYMITLFVVGLSVFATAIFSILGPALAGHFSNLFNPSGGRVVKKDHVIIVGAGMVARNTAEELVRRNIPFLQVVPTGMEPPVAEQPFVAGDMSGDTVLKEAGIAGARLLIAAADEDDENAFVVLAAKDSNPKLRVLAVASNAQAIRRLKLAHADVAFAPSEVGCRLLGGLVEGEDLPAAFRDLLNAEPSS
ncbi:MAG: NAD-binding protein [Gammaproteobacteria bacterium]